MQALQAVLKQILPLKAMYKNDDVRIDRKLEKSLS